MSADEVFRGGVQARLFVLCAYGVLNYSGGEKMLGRMGPGGRQQCDHLFHRPEDIAVGVYSGKPVLPRALCGQPQGMAQGRDLLTAKII